MIFTNTLSWLASNLWLGLRTSPFKIPLISLLPFPIFIIAALGIGFYSGLFHFGFLKRKIGFLLLFTTFVFPSLLEEAFFRGLLIPNDAIQHGAGRILFYLAVSTLLFVLWHPLNALTINPGAVPFFLKPAFLLITALLGLTCGVSYILSHSLWIPVIIHWLTVLVWVFLLGGRNKILELWG
jgi:predicted Abi (CAAX) family protease